MTDDGVSPALSIASTHASAPSLCVRSLQTQGGEFDSLSWRDSCWFFPLSNVRNPRAAKFS
jgi:hypothetical protein